MNDREAFEAWLVDFKYNAITKQFPNGEYVSAITENYFSVWQAALASQAQQPKDSVGNWLWSQLMDYVKSRGMSPAVHDDLFKIVERARQQFDSPSQAQQTESKILSFDDNGQLVDKSQAQQSQWMPIETAPKDGTVIIIWDGCKGFSSTVGAAYWSKEVKYREDLCIPDKPAGWNWSSDNRKNGMTTATHWMPLPPAPEGE